MACQLNTIPRTKPKSNDTKLDLIFKRAFCNYLSRVYDWLFAILYFPPPIWCTNGGAYQHVVIIGPIPLATKSIMVALTLAMTLLGLFS